MENLRYCHEDKGLIIYGYILMTNHLHMIASSAHSLPAILRDFKSFTSKKLYLLIRNNPKESRRKWMLNEFRKAGNRNKMNKSIQIWENGYYPTALYSNQAISQKIEYIHQNPVRAGIVDEPEYYHYSSANPNNPLHDILVL